MVLTGKYVIKQLLIHCVTLLLIYWQCDFSYTVDAGQQINEQIQQVIPVTVLQYLSLTN
jgi:ABC-type antimicrobial peptide transport system permease subunit